jgi:erythromycin esterase-like protein
MEALMVAVHDPLGRAVRAAARVQGEDEQRFDELLGAIGGARFVLIGEASHGTHEFYAVRAASCAG